MKCGFCQTPISKQLTLQKMLSFKKIIDNACCESCFFEIETVPNDKICCCYCHKPLNSESLICRDCQRWKNESADFNLKHDYLYLYNEKMKDFFQSYKFIGDIRMSRIFSGDIYQKLSTYQKQGFIIVPIPLSNQRLKERGFNQVEQLLHSSLISYHSLLKKKEDSQSQSEKNKQERLLMKQPFLVKAKNKEIIKQNKILLIDDVYTTGRTILHAYNCIQQEGPDEVRSFSLSR